MKPSLELHSIPHLKAGILKFALFINPHLLRHIALLASSGSLQQQSHRNGILEGTSQAQLGCGAPRLLLEHEPVVAVEAAAAGGALEEVVDPEVGGDDADGELEAVAAAGDLDDVEPEEEDLDGDALEVGEVVGGDGAGDIGLVAESVGALDGELAGGGSIERGREGARGVVERIGDHALGEDPRREVVVGEDFVRRFLSEGGAARRRSRGGEEEEEEAAVGEHS